MSDQTYLALFADGPQEGVTESRVLTGDAPDQEVPVVAADSDGDNEESISGIY